MAISEYKKRDYPRLYSIWYDMKRRCYKPNRPRYKDYGGRGIEVCKDWIYSFPNFCEWAFSNGYSDELTLDRINVDGNYEPSNCRWATYKEQAHNTRRTLNVTYKGISKALADWCDELGLKYDTVHSRIFELNWAVEDDFEKKSQQKDSFSSLCRKNGVNVGTVYSRINKLGWDLEKALETKSFGKGANQTTYHMGDF